MIPRNTMTGGRRPAAPGCPAHWFAERCPDSRWSGPHGSPPQSLPRYPASPPRNSCVHRLRDRQISALHKAEVGLFHQHPPASPDCPHRSACPGRPPDPPGAWVQLVEHKLAPINPAPPVTSISLILAPQYRISPGSDLPASSAPYARFADSVSAAAARCIRG